MKTMELTGALLDHWVARALGHGSASQIPYELCGTWYAVEGDGGINEWEPSTNWGQGGPIIERERINVTTKSNPDMGGNSWMAIYPKNFASRGSGPTPLVAAMRAFVTRKFGDEVE